MLVEATLFVNATQRVDTRIRQLSIPEYFVDVERAQKSRYYVEPRKIEAFDNWRGLCTKTGLKARDLLLLFLLEVGRLL